MEQIEYHEMFTRFSKYFPEGPRIIRKTSKKAKKLIENLAQKEGDEQYPTFKTLEESIAFKRDASKSNWSTFDSAKVEKDWNDWWLQKKFFSMSVEEAKTVPKEKRFIIPWPPSNVTGYLHLGHGITASIEDSMVRWHRMKGDKALFVPGVDHAGIATQAVVEKKLFAERKIKKTDIGREKFVEEVFKWKDHSCERIIQQLQSIGVSCDWDRFVFTMDETRNKSVTEAFIRLYEMGVIYRANRLVNWSCALKTAISDIEVNYEDINKPTKLQVPGHPSTYDFGYMVHFLYKTKEGQTIEVATTRIETMLGDVAVAVHPEDPRYKDFVGKELVHPFVPNRVIKVITDPDLVDMNFGTGAVKITPAHDPNDFNCGVKHGLEFINIMNEDGTMNENAGPYQGMLRYEVRIKIVKDLDKLGLLKGKEPHAMRLGFCDRSGDVVEPMVKPQWYVKMTPGLVEHMLKIVTNGELNICPAQYVNMWNGWVNKLEDWCISRQLWWGHRIPAYLVRVKTNTDHKPNPNDGQDWVVGRTEEEAFASAEKKYNTTRDNLELKQDEDVLDTWFSSALFPFSIFGWPDKTPELETFYPNSILETGWDIIFFWVARMVMMGYYLMDEKVPFKDVFLHNIVRDEKGEKMSKSKGNVIDPMEIINGCTVDVLLEKIKQSSLSEKEKASSMALKKKAFAAGIPACGNDALRFGLLNYVHHGKDINLDLNVLISIRQFCNKIWNSYRFAISVLGDNFQYNPDSIDVSKLNLADKWILTELTRACRTINKAFEEHQYSEATSAFSKFWVECFCDYYLEYSKFAVKDESRANLVKTILFHIIETGMRLLHPMMIYITEELYQKLPSWNGKSETICLAPYPLGEDRFNFEDASSFEQVLEIISDIRKVLGTITLPPKSNPPVFVVIQDDVQTSQALIKEFGFLISHLAKVGDVTVKNSSEETPKGCISVLSAKVFTLNVEVIQFIKVEDEVKKVEKTIAEKQKAIDSTKKRMQVADYTKKTPEEIRAKDQEKIDLLEAEVATLNGNVERFKKLAS